MDIDGRLDRNNGRVGDSETLDATDAELRIDDGHLIGAHPAGA
jgi:hypothetical protein